MSETPQDAQQALPAGPGYGTEPSPQDGPQPGQDILLEESEALDPDGEVPDPAVERDALAPRIVATDGTLVVRAVAPMVTPTAVLNKARAQIGFREGPSNGNPFWKWPPALSWLGNAAYCATAASWCFWQAGGLSAIYGGHYNCAEWVTAFQRHNRFHRTGGQRGDLVFFDWTGRKSGAVHVGVVESVNAQAGTVTAVEFNTSPGNAGSQSNGGGCYRRTRGMWCVVGFGRPLYGRETNVVTVSRGSERQPLDRIVLTVDGVWGPTTTRRAQQWLGLAQDGVIGPVFRRALQRAIGTTADGAWGPTTRKRLQRTVGVAQDGVWGPATIKAWQRYLNRAPIKRGVTARLRAALKRRVGK